MTRAFMLIAFGAAMGLLTSTALPKADPERHVFELRAYVTNPGKLDALHARFRDHTNALFKKHGMTVVGYWVPQTEEDGKSNKLVYLLSFPSRDAARKSWEAFRADPEWQKARAESEKDGALVNKVESVFLDPTEYSPLK
jgi:hypothetical protein